MPAFPFHPFGFRYRTLPNLTKDDYSPGLRGFVEMSCLRSVQSHLDAYPDRLNEYLEIENGPRALTGRD